MNSYKISAIALLLIIFSCASKKAYLKDNSVLAGKKLPGLIMNDIDGNRYSSFIFREKEKSIIYVSDNKEILKKLPTSDVFTWKILDVRKRPWYYPYFIYKSKFSEMKKVIIDDSKGLLDKMNLKPGSYRIELERGNIKAITSMP